MEFEDKTLPCVDCQKEFIWSADEQKFFSEKGFTNIPKRCPECRQKNRQKRKKELEKFEITCSRCQKQTMVPFKTQNDKPIYCEKCFEQLKTERKT